MDNLSFGDLLGSLWGLALVAIFFGGSIFVHELGHFLAARKRGLKIERFSIGFGPRLFGWTGKDGVDYRVSIIPLGGYVALPQLADMEGIEGAQGDRARVGVVVDAPEVMPEAERDLGQVQPGLPAADLERFLVVAGGVGRMHAEHSIAADCRDQRKTTHGLRGEGSSARCLSMPELAEVDYFRRRWDVGLGRKVSAVHLNTKARIGRGVAPAVLTKALAGAKLVESFAAAKQMAFRFSGGAWLGVHLGMTGRLEAGDADREPTPYDHFKLLMTGGKELVFVDPRQFGRVLFWQGDGAPPWWEKIPPAILSPEFTVGVADRDLLSRTRERGLRGQGHVGLV